MSQFNAVNSTFSCQVSVLHTPNQCVQFQSFLGCVFGKADILPKVSQILGSLWLVYGFVVFLGYMLYSSDPYQNRFLELEHFYLL